MTKEERRNAYRDTSISLDEQERRQKRLERRRRWHNAYELAHSKTLSCRVPRRTAQEFIRVCKRCHTTPNAALKAYVTLILGDIAPVALCTMPKVESPPQGDDAPETNGAG